MLTPGPAVHRALLLGRVGVDPLEQAVHVEHVTTLTPDLTVHQQVSSRSSCCAFRNANELLGVLGQALTKWAAIAGSLAVRTAAIVRYSADTAHVILILLRLGLGLRIGESVACCLSWAGTVGLEVPPPERDCLEVIHRNLHRVQPDLKGEWSRGGRVSCWTWGLAEAGAVPALAGRGRAHQPERVTA